MMNDLQFYRFFSCKAEWVFFLVLEILKDKKIGKIKRKECKQTLIEYGGVVNFRLISQKELRKRSPGFEYFKYSNMAETIERVE